MAILLLMNIFYTSSTLFELYSIQCTVLCTVLYIFAMERHYVSLNLLRISYFYLFFHLLVEFVELGTVELFKSLQELY